MSEVVEKDKILAASDKELNRLAATKILGWSEGNVGILTHHYKDETGRMTYMATNYKPLTYVEQAIGLLDKLQEARGARDWGITRFPRYYVCSVTCMHPSLSDCVLAVNHADKEMCRAIVIAALLAVEAIESDKPVIKEAI